jgi:hypothetical protein
MTIIDAVTDELCMWTIFHGAIEAPDKFIARLFVSDRPTSTAFVCDTLEETRDILNRLYPGLYCICRHAYDHPSVVETWV